MRRTVPISNSYELANVYRRSCEKHNTFPIPSIVEHLEKINLAETPTSATDVRTEVLNLRHETLSHNSCEALEELFKRVKYKTIDLTSCSLDDVSATAIFDMIEYYEACNEINFSENPNIKNRGWLSCKHKNTPAFQPARLSHILKQHYSPFLPCLSAAMAQKRYVLLMMIKHF